MKIFPRDVSHQEGLLRELKADPLLAAEYFELAIQALSTKEGSAGGLIALAALQDALGSLQGLASKASVGVPIFETAAEYHDWALQHS